jgi:hypothetical protein
MDDRPQSTASLVSVRIRLALRQLLEAHDFASDLGRDPWQFAVEVQGLRSTGLTNGDLRWLVCQGYVDHCLEETEAKDTERIFRRAPNLALDERSCFVLTAAGLDLALQSFGPRPETPLPAVTAAVRVGQPLPRVSPHWDDDRRILYWCGRPVKRYRYEAPNQEFVLKLFESCCWVHRLEIALPEDGGGNYKERLHDTIKQLNRSLRPVLRFRQAGAWVSWEPERQAR